MEGSTELAETLSVGLLVVLETLAPVEHGPGPHALAEPLTVLAPDVTFVADADGRSETPSRPVHGARAVAEDLVSVVEFWPPHLGVEITAVNGGPGALITTAGRPFLVFSFGVDPTDGRPVQIDAVRGPDKLRAVQR